MLVVPSNWIRLTAGRLCSPATGAAGRRDQVALVQGVGGPLVGGRPQGRKRGGNKALIEGR